MLITITVWMRFSLIRPFLPFFRSLNISHLSISSANKSLLIVNGRMHFVEFPPKGQIAGLAKSVFTLKRLERFHPK